MGAPKGNKNAEVWTLQETEDLFYKALGLSYDEQYDFIGEIAKELKTYIDVFDHLIRRFPQFAGMKKHIMRNCEANCYSNTKKGKIREATGIVNLKSNHKWTDRNDFTSKDEGLLLPLTPEERAERIALLKAKL